ncbi:MAG: TOBE domain-containing protein, partial [Bryobacteraceae bacterium]
HRIAVLHGGRLQQYDTPQAIYHRPANVFVAGFLGSPSMNFFGGTHAALPGLPEDVIVGVRPEDIDISATAQAGWHESRVYVTEEMGNESIVRLECGGCRVTIRTTPDVRLEEGSAAWFHLRSDKMHRFDAKTGDALRA